MNVYWYKKDELLPRVIAEMENVSVVLDIGSGIRPQPYIRPLVHICVDPFGQYIKTLQKKTQNEYDRTYILLQMTWQDLIKVIPKKSVDTIFLIDVVEHLPKRQGEKLLKITEQIARRQIVIFTPIGFVPQHHSDGKDAWGLDGGKWQEHKSGWQIKEFDNTWEIYACKKYHITDNMGRKFTKPFGAFWAIKTFTKSTQTKYETKQFLLHSVFRDIIDMPYDRLLRILYKQLQLIKKVLSYLPYSKHKEHNE